MPVLNAGAKGYMLKTSSADELLHAVRKVAAGELAIEQEVQQEGRISPQSYGTS